jgi:hypothetical protein
MNNHINESLVSICDAVRAMTTPPLSLLSVMFQAEKEAEQTTLDDLKQEQARHRKAAEEAATRMSIRAQLHDDDITQP